MDRRTHILQTALDCFLAKGFHGTSTREICRAAGISSGLIFHYFPTKEAIYEELVRHALTSLQPDLGAAMACPIAHLENTIAEVIALLGRHDHAARLFLFANQAQYQRGISPVVDALFRDHELAAAYEPIIRAGQERGEIRDGAAEALTLALLSALQGLAEECAINPGRPLPDPQWYLDMIRSRSQS